MSAALYYASDIHGSDVLWRKFLNAASFYEVGTLIMGGGDLCGRASRRSCANGGWTVPVSGEERHVNWRRSLRTSRSS
jgi:Icc-related predicted phosphoesterase